MMALTRPSLQPSRSRRPSRPYTRHCKRPLRAVLPKDTTSRRVWVCCATPLLTRDAKIESTVGFEDFPDEPGVYAVYDASDALQFVGITRKLRMSVMVHARDVPDLTQRVRFINKPAATRDELASIWKSFVEAHVAETGDVPPGNRSDDTTWKPKRVPKSKPELRLTPGKGIEDLTISIEELIDQVVKSCKVVAFIKGTRKEPQCGFSYQVLNLLNQNRVEYEVVNVMDEVHNPTLRETLKSYSQWPTIPQLYVNGEFVGGADIVTEMQEKGELQKLLQA